MKPGKPAPLRKAAKHREPPGALKGETTQQKEGYIMGYESNIIIVKRSEYRNINRTIIHGEQIAQVKMAKMERGFYELFKKNGTLIDFDLYIHYGDEGTKTDCYGEHCKMIDLPTLANYLHEQINNGETYRRLKPLLALIEAFNPEQWEVDTLTHKTHLYAVHYGY